MQTYTELPGHVSEKFAGIKVFFVLVKAGGEDCELYHRAKMTRRQLRHARRQLRNYTMDVFDNFGPDPLTPNMHRMKGARQAYKRRGIK
jgi:hypothetical protein